LSQNLNIAVQYPYIAATPIGIDAAFGLYKRDTTYLELKRMLGLRYEASRGLSLRLFGSYTSSDLLSVKQFQFAQTLPDFADVRKTQYGAGVDYINLDYLFNPRKGIEMYTEIAAGNRTIRVNESLPEMIYENVDLQSAQYQASGRIDLFVPLKNRSTVRIGFAGGGIESERLFINELFRIGGLRSLRGFDEESILASAYGTALLEYRFLLEENAYFALFVNGAWYEKNIPDAYVRDFPWGFGTGLNLETALGIFSISYALGSEFGNPVDFRAGKIHFGLLNSF
jgi:outer membrane protein assembly factor BamA